MDSDTTPLFSSSNASVNGEGASTATNAALFNTGRSIADILFSASKGSRETHGSGVGPSAVGRQSYLSITSEFDSEGNAVDGSPAAARNRSESVVLEVQQHKSRGLNTFFGVFVPIVLSIFCVTFFLRLGYVVGQSGFPVSQGMLVLAYSIVTLTALSVSAVSTNGVVKGGGAYFMISRALGPEFGGSIGVILYCALVTSTAMYIIGFVESLDEALGGHGLPTSTWWNFLYGTVILFLISFICVVGADLYAKSNFFIFLIVSVSVISIVISFFVKKPFSELTPSDNLRIPFNTTLSYTGLNLTTFKGNTATHYTPDYSTPPNCIDDCNHQDFQTVFSILFNGCTGIMAGANMSGDLANPSRSIPRGTVVALIFTYVMFVAIMLLSAFSVERSFLINDYNYLQNINVWSPLVTVGVMLATLSASLSTLIGSTRILLALARDDLLAPLTNPFKRLWKGEPVFAIFCSYFIVQLILIVGNINAIAPIVTMFYLLVYGVTNLACFTLTVAGSPNFRPTFRFFSRYTAALGTLMCLGAMFFVNYVYASAAFVVMVLLFSYILYRAPVKSWGDVSQALIYHQVRKFLLRLDLRKEHVKFWRPQILLLVKNPRTSMYLIDFVNDIKKGGLFVLGHIVPTPFTSAVAEGINHQMPAWLQMVEEFKLKAFVDMIPGDTLRQGARALLFSSGLGGMRPNTVILGFMDDVQMQTDALREMQRRQNETKSLRFKRKSAATTQNDVLNRIPGLPGDATYNAESPADPIIAATRNYKMAASEYISMLRDAIALGKNVCVARHFDHCMAPSSTHTHTNTNGSSSGSGSGNGNGSATSTAARSANVSPTNAGHASTSSSLSAPAATTIPIGTDTVVTSVIAGSDYDARGPHVDVWLLPAPGFDYSHQSDEECERTFLLLLQLSCVLCAVRRWSKVRLRVIIVNIRTQESRFTSTHDSATGEGNPAESSLEDGADEEYRRVVEILSELRVSADVLVIPSPAKTASPSSDVGAINALMREHSHAAEVVFLPLPPPPPTEGAGDAEYLTRLTQLTKGLPPSLMTYGATTVFQTEVD